VFCRETEHSFSRNFEIFALAFACTYISCCSIFNDQFLSHAHSRAHSLGIIPHSFILVKWFLKSFFVFFEKLLLTAFIGRKCFVLYHIFLYLSRGFLKLFSSFFLSREILAFVILPKRSVESLNIISYNFEFVKCQKKNFHCALCT